MLRTAARLAGMVACLGMGSEAGWMAAEGGMVEMAATGAPEGCLEDSERAAEALAVGKAAARAAVARAAEEVAVEREAVVREVAAREEVTAVARAEAAVEAPAACLEAEYTAEASAEPPNRANWAVPVVAAASAGRAEQRETEA